MAVFIRNKMRALACTLGIATILGSTIPDIDHISEALGSFPSGRFSHQALFAIALFFAGYNLAYLGGLYLRLILRGDKNENCDDEHR